MILSWVMSFRHFYARLGSLAAIALVVVALAQGWATSWINGPPAPLNSYRQQVNAANGRCPTLWAMGPIQGQPAGMVMTGSSKR